MTRFLVVAAGLLVMGPSTVDAQSAGKAPRNLNCYTGPARRAFGGADWLVYSCDDARSMVVISTEKNPANPFYFVLASESAGYRIDGEGTGNKQTSDAAGYELAHMTAADFANLLAETKSATAANR
jgi:hypothetical protein